MGTKPGAERSAAPGSIAPPMGRLKAGGFRGRLRRSRASLLLAVSLPTQEVRFLGRRCALPQALLLYSCGAKTGRTLDVCGCLPVHATY